MISRRTILKRIPAFGLAATVPAASAATAREHPERRVRRLAKELSQALGELHMPMFAEVFPPEQNDFPVLLGDIDVRERWMSEAREALLVKGYFERVEGMPAEDRARYHMQRLKCAMNEVIPGAWRTELAFEHEFALIVRDDTISI